MPGDQKNGADQNPLANLDPSGQASILNYQLPAETAFPVHNHVRIAVNHNDWTKLALTPPKDDPWEAVEAPKKTSPKGKRGGKGAGPSFGDELRDAWKKRAEETRKAPPHLGPDDRRELDPALVE